MKIRASKTDFSPVPEQVKFKISVDQIQFTVKPKPGGLILTKIRSTKNIVKEDDKNILSVSEKISTQILRTTD